jgi:DNA repair protein RAD16
MGGPPYLPIRAPPFITVLTSACGHARHQRCDQFMITDFCPGCLGPLEPFRLQQHLSSTKINRVVDCVQNGEGHKFLIFCNFVETVEILARRFMVEGIVAATITGDTSLAKRQSLQGQLNDPDGALRVLILTLRTGGEGLNLPGATTVLFVDPWWNPQAENQAAHRAHRIGVIGEVRVLKFVSKDTVEERIVNLQAKKKRVFGAVIDGEELTNLSAVDMRYLLGLGQR